jgi:hypothetical protein
MRRFRIPLCCAVLACLLAAACTPQTTGIDPTSAPSAAVTEQSPSENSAVPAAAASPSPESDTVSAVASGTSSPEHDAVPAAEPVVFRSGAMFSPDATSVSVVLDADELTLLDRFPALRFADLSGSACFSEIFAWTEAHPSVSVRYTVPLGNTAIPSDAESAEIQSLSDPAPLAYLPALRTLTISRPITPETAVAMLSLRPDLTPHYTVQAGDRTFSSEAVEIDASGFSPAYAEALAKAAPALPKLEKISLLNASGWTLDDADLLQRARDGLLVDYPVEAFGVRFSLADEVVSFNDIDLGRKVDELRALLPYLRNVRRLDMENCGIRNDVMAQLREDFPQPKIVWRIRVGRYYSCRTDSIMIRCSYDLDEARLRDKDLTALKYCNEVQYLDLGHNRFTKTDFLAYMPEIRVLIIAAGYVTNISGVEHCTKLEYCEFLSGGIRDVSPLAACTELRHLNLSYNLISDITPLYGLKNLERLWISRNPIPADQIETIKTLLPDCTINTTTQNPTGEGWRYLPDGSRCERYELLRKQFFYDLHITSYTEDTKPVLPDE